MEALNSKKAIRQFFSKQRNSALLTYIFGNFTELNFDKDNGLFIKSNGKTEVLDPVFNDKEWLSLKNLCKI